MLKYNNKDDILKMMQYHRTRDMINLLKYFPDLSPVRDLVVVTSIEDFLNNYDYCSSFTCERNDTLITKSSMVSVEAQKLDRDLLDIFKRVKKLDDDGVLVLFNLTHAPSERYERYAGISVGVSVGKGVYIDAVGKGFDGREVSKGIDCHERYYIPWFDIRKCNIGNFKSYRTYLISDEEYVLSRKMRIDFLRSVGIDEKVALENVPEVYREIPDFIWTDIIKNLLKRLEYMEDELASIGLIEFAMSGHTEGKRFLPWQMFDKSRYVT